MTNILYPRFSTTLIEEAMTDTPVILIHGSRQCGKITIAQNIGYKQGYHYISLDDDTQREAAQVDPVGFVQSLPEKVILDEVQRVPTLFTALKLMIDSNRQPGRFILTGSANILLLPKLADSMAGRMEIIHLRPLSQFEIYGEQPRLFEQMFNSALPINATQYQRLGESLASIIVAGGYPAAIVRKTEKRRQHWYQDYINAMIQRDIQDITRIRNLDILPKLLAAAASHTAQLFNASELSSPFAISQPTAREYLALLEQIFMIERLQPWHNNRFSRLIKTPKLHLSDTGLACALLGITAQSLWQDKALLGQLLETFIYQELKKHADWYGDDIRFYHFRDKDQSEVDIVIESGKRLIGIEVKLAASVSKQDFKGLIKLQTSHAAQFVSGIVFYDGSSIIPFGDKLLAVPIRLLIPDLRCPT